MLMDQAVLSCCEWHYGTFEFLEKDSKIFLVGVMAQPGFEAPPVLQQVHILCGYSTFWPEKHFL